MELVAMRLPKIPKLPKLRLWPRDWASPWFAYSCLVISVAEMHQFRIPTAPAGTPLPVTVQTADWITQLADELVEKTEEFLLWYNTCIETQTERTCAIFAGYLSQF